MRLLIAVAIVLGYAIAGVCLIRWSLCRSSFRILVRPDGLDVYDSSAGRVIGWDDIETVTEIRDMMPLFLRWTVRNPDRWITRGLYILRDEEGELLSFDANTVHDHVSLGTMIKEATDCRGVPWNIIEQFCD